MFHKGKRLLNEKKKLIIKEWPWICFIIIHDQWNHINRNNARYDNPSTLNVLFIYEINDLSNYTLKTCSIEKVLSKYLWKKNSED